MELKVKNEAEKALAEKLQTNLATYVELTEEERLFLSDNVEFCQFLNDGGAWIQASGIRGGARYHIDPKVNIIVEQEQKQTFSEREGLILCHIEKRNSAPGWFIKYPIPISVCVETLGALHCKDFEHLGWVHGGKCDDWGDIYNNVIVFINEDGTFWSNMASNRKPSTATHSVWRKVEK